MWGFFALAFRVFLKRKGGRFHIKSPAFWLPLAIRRSSGAGLPSRNGQHQLKLANRCPSSWGT